MKNLRYLALLCGALCATLLLFSARDLHAQATANPPGKLTYQGFLTRANGTPFGDQQPESKTITFRIWKTATGSDSGNLVWAETQNVILDKGHFSVLLGEGIAETANSAKFSATPATTAFTGSDASERHMEIVVDGIAISSRLQFLPAPYAALSLNARNLVDNKGAVGLTATDGNVGIGTTASPTERLEVNGKVKATEFVGNLAGNAATATTAITATTANGLAEATYGNKLTLNNTANSFFGIGSGLTALDATKITTGILPLANGGTGSSTKNFVDLTSDQTAIAGTKAFTGKVGIGTQNPITALGYPSDDYVGFHVAAGGSRSGIGIIEGTAVARLHFHNRGGTANKSKHFYMQNGAEKFTFGWMNDGLGNADGQNRMMVFSADGQLGIGTATPTQAKLVVNGAPGFNDLRGYYFGPTAGTGNTYIGMNSLSIFASGNVGANGYYTTSDERIKRIGGHSDAARDLATIQGIEVTDYSYVDTIAKGPAKHKKVIAQQVEKIYPQAVSKSTDVVPDIYQKATIQDGWVKLATNLKKGERVRLIGEKEEGIHEVLEVQADGFRTAFNPKGEKVFVYGREVKDFRSVDYEAISMLNVSATQELARQVAALRQSQARVAELEEKTSQLEQKAARVDAELAELKKLIARVTGPRPEQRPAAEVPVSAAGK